MPRIFISYRRNDSAGRIYDRLEGHFGQGQVFMDVDTIEPGLDFVDVVQEAVGSCDAVIGREWLVASDESSRKQQQQCPNTCSLRRACPDPAAGGVGRAVVR